MNKSSLYNVALQCARFNASGCAHNCEACQYNIFNYGLEINEASLLKANAYTDYYDQKKVLDKVNTEIESVRMAPLIIVGIIVGLVAWTCHSMKSCIQPTQAIAQEWSYEQPTQQVENNSLGNQLLQLFLGAEEARIKADPNNRENIGRILELMQLQGVPDLNKDGNIDCIDYSLRFRQLYGSKAHIIINVNPNNGFNHMFLRVYYGNQWMDIEPQGTSDRYSMGAVWGVKYNPQFNRDVTNQWTHVVGGM